MTMHPLDPVYFLPVPGTWAFKATSDASDWFHRDSPFSIYLYDRALVRIKSSRSYEWTTAAGGTRFWLRWAGAVSTNDHRDWLVAGRNLYAWLRPPVTDSDDYVHIVDRNLIAHSHALQVVLYACAEGLKINRLISVSGPVRHDMREIAKLARPNIAHWLHVHSDASDHTQWFGTIGDGFFGIVREHPLADRNVGIADVGHGGLLNDPKHFHCWEDAGLIEFLRTEEPPREAA